MNRPLWKWILAISLAFNVGIAVSLATGMGRDARQHETQPAGVIDLHQHLQLTAEQSKRWADIEQGFLQDLSTNWRAIRQHRETLIRQIFEATPDRAAIDAEQAKIAALQDAQQRRVIAQLLAERELLNPQQRAALMTLLLNRYQEESMQEERLHRH